MSEQFGKWYLFWILKSVKCCVGQWTCLLQLTTSMLCCLHCLAVSKSARQTYVLVHFPFCDFSKLHIWKICNIFLPHHCFNQALTLVTLLFPWFPGERGNVPVLLLCTNDFLHRGAYNSNSCLTWFKWLANFWAKINKKTLSFLWKALTISKVYFVNAI